jgi:hypothetical protein
MSGVADHLANRLAGWLDRVESVGSNDIAERETLALQGWALGEIFNGVKWRNGIDADLIRRFKAKFGELGKTGANQPQTISHYLQHCRTQVENSSSIEPGEAYLTILEGLLIGEKKAGPANRADAAALFNWAVTNLHHFEDVAAQAQEEMRSCLRWGRLPGVFCASVARTGWAPQEDDVEEEVGAFEPIEVFARRGANGSLSLQEFARRLEGVSWWCLKSDFRRLRISIEVKASALTLEVYEGEVPAQTAAKVKTSASLDGAAVRARFGGREEAAAAINKGVARLRTPPRIDPEGFELRMRRPGDGNWVEIYGSESAGQADA